ncbi:MAG: Rossmann-like and DUF2520 domain-containing protein [Rikenellaceae bacterium]
MRVAIIGSGNVAEALALAIERSRAELVQVYGRNRERVEVIYRAIGRVDEVVESERREQNDGHGAQDEGCESELREADIYLVAVSDGAVEEITKELNFADGSIVAHTAASVNIEQISTRKGINRGVFYPLQTFTKGREVEFQKIPIFIEAQSEESYKRLEELANLLSERVQRLDLERRRELHLAAVFSCNFTMAMLTATQDVLRGCELPLELYEPLLRETLDKAFSEQNDLRKSLTGPAVRGDLGTQERHIEMLSGVKESDLLIEIYKNISKYIWETSKRI